MSDTPFGTLNYTRTDSVALPQSAAEIRFAIRKSDWERLKRNVGRCKDNSPTLADWYFCCFGIAGSSGVSIVPLLFAAGLPAWVVPAYGCTTAFAAVLGIVLLIVNRRVVRQRLDTVDDLSIDMKEIESGFPF